MPLHVVQSSAYAGISHSEIKRPISGCLRKYLRVQSTKHSRLTAMGPLSIIASTIAIASPVSVRLQKLRDGRHAKTDLSLLLNEVAEIVLLLQELGQEFFDSRDNQVASSSRRG